MENRINQNCIIVDIDDCLMDSRCMSKYLPEDQKSREGWDKFHGHYNECEPNAHFFNLIKNYRSKIFFLTSREDTGNVRFVTMQFLQGQFYNFDLIMRPYECYDSSPVVKKALYEEFIVNNNKKINYHVEFAIDDDPANNEMWRSLGIPTFLHQYGNAKT